MMKAKYSNLPPLGVSRREFILSGLAASFVAGCRTMDLFGRPALTFGVVSDIHVTSAGTEARYEKALRLFKSRGADAVMVCGDIADWGTVNSWEHVRDACKRVFDGTETVPLLCTGNHDFEGWWYGDMTMDMHASGHSEDEAAVKAKGGVKAEWERVFGEEYAPVRLRTVKGYDFVSTEYADDDKGKHRPDAAAFLVAYAKRLRDSGKPFFYFQHLPIKGTTGDSHGWADGGSVFPVLKTFPNAIAFTGHTHRPFVDERQIWQGEFTAIGTPSLSYPGLPGHENGSAKRDGSATNAMPMIPVRRDLEGTQGFFVNVYTDRVVVERIDVEADEWDREVAPAWIIPLDGTKPFAPAEAEKRVPVPAFPEDAEVRCEMRNTENRQGKWTIVMTCEFPSAVVPEGWRVFDYEIRAVPKDGSKPLVKMFYSPAYHKLASCEPARQRFWFDVAELPQDKDYTIEVRARNCFEKVSEPIVAKRVFHSVPGLGKARR